MTASPNDRNAASAQLGRPLRGELRAVRRCHLSLPVVLEVAPQLPDGEPFPTLYWLSCPLAHRRVARLEAAGGVREMDRRAAEDASFRAELEAAHAQYAASRAKRAEALPEGRGLRGGVGGSTFGTKCLHAHLAHHLAGGPNPVGRAIECDVLPLDCKEPCVVGEGVETRRNPAWFEPKLRG